MKEILAEAEATVAVGDVLAILETEEEVAEEEPDTAPSSGPPKSDEWVAPVAPLRPTVEKKPIPLPSAGSPSTPPLTARPGSGAGLLSPRVQRFGVSRTPSLMTCNRRCPPR